MVLVKDSGLTFVYMIVVADTGFESMMYNLLSIHALFDLHKYSTWQIRFPLLPIPVIHFPQLYGVGPL